VLQRKDLGPEMNDEEEIKYTAEMLGNWVVNQDAKEVNPLLQKMLKDLSYNNTSGVNSSESETVPDPIKTDKILIPTKVDLDVAGMPCDSAQFRTVRFSDREPIWYIPGFKCIIIKTTQRTYFGWNAEAHDKETKACFVAINVQGSFLGVINESAEQLDSLDGCPIDLEILTHLKL